MKAFRDLIKIASIEGISPNMGSVAREEALRQWIKEYMVGIEIDQAIIKKELNHEDEVVIKNHIVESITEEIFDDCVDFNIEPNRVSGKLWAVKR